MDISYYYQILDTGISYEKGRKKGKLWGIGERKRLREEILFWQSILAFISDEEKGNQCSQKLFESLDRLCRKYNLSNYERILEKKEEIVKSNSVFERNKDEEIKICNFMERLLIDMKKSLDEERDKEKVYRIMGILHNLPKVMHGRNILNSTCVSISYKDAINYAKGYMNEGMKKEYAMYLENV